MIKITVDVHPDGTIKSIDKYDFSVARQKVYLTVSFNGQEMKTKKITIKQ